MFSARQLCPRTSSTTRPRRRSEPISRRSCSDCPRVGASIAARTGSTGAVPWHVLPGRLEGQRQADASISVCVMRTRGHQPKVTIGTSVASIPMRRWPSRQLPRRRMRRIPIPEVAPSAFSVRGGLLFASDSDPGTVNPDKSNFQPRVGFVYQANEKTVLRGGWAIYTRPGALRQWHLSTRLFPGHQHHPVTGQRRDHSARPSPIRFPTAWRTLQATARE